MARSVMLRKLAAYRRQNQLDLALQELGQIERTRFMLDWLESPELRRRCHAGLSNSEQRHFLAQVICTFKQGRQTRPANKAGLPTQCRGASSFVPPASTSSSPRSCSGTHLHRRRRPMHGSPIHRGSAGSTSAGDRHPPLPCGAGGWPERPADREPLSRRAQQDPLSEYLPRQSFTPI